MTYYDMYEMCYRCVETCWPFGTPCEGNYFAFWPDGGCLITGTDSKRVAAENYEVISGPP